MFCFVNLRGCLRDLGDWTSVWFICSFGLPFSDNWWYFALCKVISQWFSMVAFSQTRALHHPNECLHWWERVESLRCVEVEKKKKAQGSMRWNILRACLSLAQECQNECCLKGGCLALVGANLCAKVACLLWHRGNGSIFRCRDQKQCFKGCNGGYPLPIQLFIFVWFSF